MEEHMAPPIYFKGLILSKNSVVELFPDTVERLQSSKSNVYEDNDRHMAPIR